MATPSTVNLTTPITVKVAYGGSQKKFKLPLGDLAPVSLIAQLRRLLDIPDHKVVVFERFSDSHNSYMSLAPNQLANYKSLQRAAKAKLKLRLRAFDEASRPVDLAAAMSESDVSSGPRTSLSLRPKATAQSPLNALSLNPLFSASEATLNNTSGGVRVSADPSTIHLDADAKGEAPVPAPLDARTCFFNELAKNTRDQQQKLSIRSKPAATQTATSIPQLTGWSVYCNACEALIPNEHYHCSICDNGDYDLCTTCIANEKHCNNALHWLIKRSIEGGKVQSSTTERIAPKINIDPTPPTKTALKVNMPGAFEKKAEPRIEQVEQVEQPKEATRTCNSCVQVFEEAEFVHCQECEDFDLCIPCLTGQKHGHHPGHEFRPAVDGTQIGPLAGFFAAAGRNARHHAVCDNCNDNIYGVRHKCTECPDWDYCSRCFAQAPAIHPGHRFAAIYEPMVPQMSYQPRHCGIYCDGALCNKSGPNSSRSYIRGVRYKCTICHDTDFCANCEASPKNTHNRTHPLIKFKTPVKNVSVTTLGEDKNGVIKATMGDNTPKKQIVCTRPHSVAFANGISKVQPILDLKPAEELPAKPLKEKIEIKDLLSSPISEKIKGQDFLSAPAAIAHGVPSPMELHAHFIRDTPGDGTKMMPDQRFMQTWTLRNPGPHSWPRGCRVSFVGGDHMANASSNLTDRPVAKGEEICFHVSMQASAHEGTNISYWRLFTPRDMPFGQRLWCHIDVVAKPVAVAELARNVATSGRTSPPAASRTRNPAEVQQLLEDLHSKRASVLCALNKQEMGMKADAERMRQAERVHTLHVKLANAKKLAALRQSKMDEAQSWGRIAMVPPKPTVEDANENEKEEAKVAATVVAAPPAAAMSVPVPVSACSPARSMGPSVRFTGDCGLTLPQREALQRQLTARHWAKTMAPATGAVLQPGGFTAPPPPPPATPLFASASTSVPMSSSFVEQPQMKMASPLPKDMNLTTNATKVKNVLDDMIFPTLEKESPASSTMDVQTQKSESEYQASSLTSATEVAVQEAPASPAVTAVTQTETVVTEESDVSFDDAKSVELLEVSSEEGSEDGFVTDEEYDILDGSDEEFA